MGKGMHGSGWSPEVLNPSSSMPGLKRLPLWSPCEVPVPSGHSCCPRLCERSRISSLKGLIQRGYIRRKIIWTRTLKRHCHQFQQLSQIPWSWAHRSFCQAGSWGITQRPCVCTAVSASRPAKQGQRKSFS